MELVSVMLLIKTESKTVPYAAGWHILIGP